MALFDYYCPVCDYTFEDIYQPIGSEAEVACPEGHSWKRLISGVKIDPTFKGPGSLSPQMQTFWETGDPELAFPKGKPDADAFTIDDLTPEMIEKNIAPDSPDEWATSQSA